MDVLNEQIIDIGLRITGYLAAAGLGMLLYSAVAGRRRSSLSTDSTPMKAPERLLAATPGHGDVQFVDLRKQKGDDVFSKSASSKTSPALKTDSLRDRPEIIRLARQMLKAGTPAEMIRRTLPITDAELALLQSASAR